MLLSDGTGATTVLVKDIYPGLSDSSTGNLTNLNGLLLLTADGGATGIELWKSNGTAAGTVLVKDINPGSGTSSPNTLTNVNGTVFFAAEVAATGVELWKTDGTAAAGRLHRNLCTE